MLECGFAQDHLTALRQGNLQIRRKAHWFACSQATSHGAARCHRIEFIVIC